MEIVSLLLMLLMCFAGGFIAHRYGASISLIRLNFVSWYFGVEFILTAVLATLNISYFYKMGDIVFEYIPKGDIPELEVIWTLSWCAIGIPLGFVLANKLLSKLNMKSNYDKFVKARLSGDTSFSFECIWVSIVIVYAVFVVAKVGFIPQVEFFGADAEAIAHFRGSMTHNFPASVHLKELIGVKISPILSYYFFAKVIRTRDLNSIFFFVLLAVLSCFYMTLNLNKSGLPFYFIGLIITYGIVSIRISKKKVLITGAVGIFLLLGSYAMTRKTSNLSSIISSIYSRIVYSQASGNYLSLYIFPKVHSHLGFTSISKFGKYLGLEYSEPASRIMMKEIDPVLVKSGKAGFQVSTFFAEAWANWGIVGLVLSPIYVGFFIKFLIGVIITVRKTYLTCAFLGFVSYSLNISSGFNNLIFPRYLILIILLFIGTKIISEKIDQKIMGKNV